MKYLVLVLLTISPAFASLNTQAIDLLHKQTADDNVLVFHGLTYQDHECRVEIRHNAEGIRISMLDLGSEEADGPGPAHIQFDVPVEAETRGLKNAVTEIDGGEYFLKIKISAEKDKLIFSGKKTVQREITLGFEDDGAINEITVKDGWRRSMRCFRAGS